MSYPLVDLALARRLERAEGTAARRIVEARARVLPDRGACWTEAGSVFAMFDGVASPVTQTFGLGMAEPATVEILGALEGFFAERGAPVNHEVSPVSDPATIALLVERGYHPIELTSVMYRPIAADLALAAVPSHVRVRPIGAGDALVWAETAATGWRDQGADLSGFIHETARTLAVAEGYQLFLAEIDGRPVAAGGLAFHDGVVLLAGASTIPQARRQGAQLALLHARLRYGVAAGCDLAMMGAQPGSGSQRNAERHGFRIAYTRIKWCRQNGC
jgi:hypothetical protein